MRIPKDVIFGEKASLEKSKIYRTLKKKDLIFDLFIITKPLGGSGLMEIYPSYVLYQKIYETSDIQILGIAKGRDEAMEIVSSIAVKMVTSD